MPAISLNPDGIMRNAAVAVQHDTNDLDHHALGFVASAGNVRFTPEGMTDADAITMTVVAGQFYPIAVRKIWDTLTTSTQVVIFW